MQALGRAFICFILSISIAALIGETNHPAQVAGVYEGAVVVKNSDARKITLRLAQDGGGEFVDAQNKHPARWSVAGQELEVSVEGSAAPMIWRIKGNSLTLKSADRTNYGKKGLMLRRPR